MNFDLTSEQQMLKDSVDRFVSDHYDLEQRQKYTRLKGGFDAAHWQSMAELGWLGLPFAETDGGFGGSAVDTMLLMESFGRGLVVEPYLATVILGGHILAQHAPASIKASLLPEIIGGSSHLALAYAEHQAHFDDHNVATRAELDGDDYQISGQKSMVLNGGTADHFIVSARTSGAQTETDGITLFLIPRDAQGLKVTAFPTVDGLQAAELTLEQVTVAAANVLGELDYGYSALQSAVQVGILAVCAEAVGAMEMLYKDTTAYIQEREQFDHPLADFQVLRHRMVDMFMECEQARSLLLRATLEVEQHSPSAQRTVHALKHFIGKTGIMIGEHAVQTHGGMGMTEELRIGHYFKRLLVIDALFGNSDYHLAQFTN